ncbi:hypothetical protein ACOS9E_11980 [Escherichia coli]|uniref:hypothetical protein n=1 Tax=Escherichia coli TaxID=562 RepID=UPI0010CB39EC|nr:hypothetical protein [Escherichia coli]
MWQFSSPLLAQYHLLYPTRFWASALIAKPHVLMADNIIPAPKRRHTGIAAARRAAKRRRRAKR